VFKPEVPVSRLTALVFLVAGTFFLENLDGTIITPALPVMARSFSVHPVDLNAGVSAYMLTLGVMIPLSGWVAERFGARRVFSFAIALFTLASVLCGLASTLPTFIAARILQGTGGALMVPVGRLVVLRSTPKDQLITAIATLTWPALVAPVLGPPLGGIIVDHAPWQWIFFLVVPLGIAAFFVSLSVTPDLKGHEMRPFDWASFLLTGGGLFGLMFAAESLARPQAPFVQASASVIFGALLLAAGVVHLKRAEFPLLSLKPLSEPTFAVAIWGGTFFRMGVAAVPFLLPLMLQLAFGMSAFTSGLTLMAVFAGNIAMKSMTTPVLRRFGFRPVLVTNGVINALSIAACATFAKTSSEWLLCTVLFLGGMSRSMQFTAYSTLAFADISNEHMGSANALFSTAVQLGMGMGIAFGAIAWRAAQSFTPMSTPASAFHVAFLFVGAISAFGLWDSVKLSRTAGEHLVQTKQEQ
jgi:EmrB/QacA subfamily drug resistance transporter